LLLGRRVDLRRRHAVGERGSAQDDDHGEAAGRRRPLAEHRRPGGGGDVGGVLADSRHGVDGHDGRGDDGDEA
jgi:hypothetical protein